MGNGINDKKNPIIRLVKSKNENSQTFFNILSTVITSGIAFLTMPIFTRLLGAEQYGHYSIYHAWLTIMACIIGLNTQAGIGTGFYRFKEKYYAFRNSTLVMGTVISIVMIAILMVSYPLIEPAFGYSATLFFLLLLNAFANYVMNVSNMAWIYEKQAARNMAAAVTSFVISSLLSIVLLVAWKWDLPLFYARAIGIAIPQIIIAIIVWIVLYRECPSGFNREYWQYSLLFGLPMVFHLLSHQVLGQSDRLMMKWFGVDAGQIGIYSFFYTYVAILTTLLNALNTSWCPFLYDDLSKGNYDRINKRINHYVQIFVILCLGFLLLSREVMKIFASEEFWPGAPIVPILVLVVYCTFFYQFGVNFEFFHKKPRYVAIGTTLAAACNIALNAIMIPKWGMYGAAYATLVSYALLAGFHTIIVKTWRVEKYPLSYKTVIFGLLFVMRGCAAYIFMAKLILIRWLMAIALGVYLISSIYRRKTIF